MKDIVTNKKAYHDYEIIEKYEVGVSLVGSEVKSLRAGKVSLKEAYVSFVSGEAYIKSMHIAEYKDATYNNHEETRDRKLLLHKKEINKLFSKCKIKGFTCIPLRIYFNDRGRIKIEIALARGKTLYDKRMSDKQKTMEKAAAQALKR